MRFQVVPKVACSKGCMITLAASIDFSPLWDLKCIFKSAGQVDANLHWLHLFDFSPLCVFKCIIKHSWFSQVPQPTCLTFLHYVFSNVSSNCLPVWMESHIGCIYFDFSPMCVFKCLLKSPMQSHIGCISLMFLRCIFLKVSSMYLDQRRHIIALVVLV